MAPTFFFFISLSCVCVREVVRARRTDGWVCVGMYVVMDVCMYVCVGMYAHPPIFFGLVWGWGCWIWAIHTYISISISILTCFFVDTSINLARFYFYFYFYILM